MFSLLISALPGCPRLPFVTPAMPADSPLLTSALPGCPPVDLPTPAIQPFTCPPPLSCYLSVTSQGMFSTTEVVIERGVYCCYDPFSRRDVRWELCVPGGVRGGSVDAKVSVDPGWRLRACRCSTS
eukprot:105531-Chlamydomonas_euryale.AAC.3